MTKKIQEPSKTYNVYELDQTDLGAYKQGKYVLTTNCLGVAKSALDGSRKPMMMTGALIYADNTSRLSAPKLKVTAPAVRARRKTTKV